MATVIAGNEGRNLFPMRYIADLFKQQTLQQLQINMMTQRIWPYEVYPGYRVRNERRKTLGGWVSTGEGIKSFEGSVIEADEETGMVTMAFRFNDYMQYVDIGVGAGRKAEDVNRSKNVKFKQRYVSKWNPAGGATHRPGIRPELNHLLTRLEGYVQRYYDAKIDFKILETFEGQPWSFL
jgi:hypothetical protein